MADHFERTVADALSDDARLKRMSDAARQFVREKKGRATLLNYVVDTTLAEKSRA
jgi:UDP-N-acetylglucosamine:LPS N-acetylglucosamine transferase